MQGGGAVGRRGDVDGRSGMDNVDLYSEDEVVVVVEASEACASGACLESVGPDVCSRYAIRAAR